MPRINPLTPDILIEVLKRSGLNTVLIEGIDDLQIYRNIEKELDIIDLDFLSCGGRTKLLEIYKRKNEISSKLLFICDSDLWLFFGRPDFADEDLITTEGYSIENELYQDGEHILIKLLTDDEKLKLALIIKNVCLWYSREVEKAINEQSYDCSFSNVSLLNTAIIPKKSIEFSAEFLNKINFQEPDEAIFQDILTNYQVKLRGKFLFQAYIKIFQERGKEGIKYSVDQLFDLIYRMVISENSEDSILIKRRNIIQSYFNS
ncbi:hypothetical protein [Adhaeribacter pallidiroseus]|uniref:DUF4435 domain-containing protein n=1 Tax=Adhaeribacter pallidiroseus TaxID=2072847 RepID=A0A369QJE7_9BACT|nr:hypothetical protein [Adhaeribacter pallidiroseus]RDC65031.1 hypothetical protein AHMF7616_03654 [Adhaeribacter pallidiroseus]